MNVQMEAQIENLAQWATRRIERDGKFASRAELVRIHALTVREAQDRLDTCSAVAAARVHARINQMMGVA